MLQKDHIDLIKPLKHSAYIATKEAKVSTGKGARVPGSTRNAELCFLGKVHYFLRILISVALGRHQKACFFGGFTLPPLQLQRAATAVMKRHVPEQAREESISLTYTSIY